MTQETVMHFDYAPTKDCNNPDTYGEICVKCNQCGRFDEPTNAEKS